MREEKIPVALKRPDKVVAHYGTKEFILDLPHFDQYIFSVKESDLPMIEKYMMKGEQE